jgi:hypothetical protein
MDPRPDPGIVSFDRLHNGVVVSFDDGKTALYSAALLYATLPQAHEILSESEGDGLLTSRNA